MPQSWPPKLLSQQYDSINLFIKWFPKTILQSGSRKLRPKTTTKITPQTYYPKLLPQSYDSSILYPKIDPQCYSVKWLPKAAPENWYWKRLPEIDCKITSKSCSPKILLKNPKLFPKPAPLNYSPKPLPKIVIESCSEQLLPKAAKAAPGSCFQKRLPKLFFLLLAKIIIFQHNCSSMLRQSRKVAPRSRSSKCLPKVVPRHYSPKLYRCFPKLMPQNYDSPNLSIAPKLLPKAILRSCL